MTDREPTAEPFSADDHGTPAPWSEALGRLGNNETYWLATVRPDGRPHLVPLLAVWVDAAVYFCAGAGSRKARNLARNARCVLSVGGAVLDLVIEGEAAKVSDASTLDRVADAYASAYDWNVTVRDGAFHDAEGAPTAGPPPYDVYKVTPRTAFGFGTDEAFSPTRWRF